MKLREHRRINKNVSYLCCLECVVDAILTSSRTPRPTPEHYLITHGKVEMPPGEIWSHTLKKPFRSSYERIFAESLHKLSISFAYEKFYFWVGHTIYIPDFYIPTKDVFVEVKGLWGMGSRKKTEMLMRTYPDVELIVAQAHVFK